MSRQDMSTGAACDCAHLRALRRLLGAVHGTSVERIKQFRPFRQGLSRLGVTEPIPIPLVLLRPLRLLLLDGRFEEMVRGLGGLRR